MTIVVGANNAGKSTIWESFDAVARKQQGDVSFSEGRRNSHAETGIRIHLERSNRSEFLLESLGPNTSETKGAWVGGDGDDQPVEIVSVPSRRQFQATFGRSGIVERDWMTTGTEFTRSPQMDQFTGRLFELHNDEIKKAKFDELMSRVLGEPLDWAIDLGEGQFGQSYYLKVTSKDGISHSSEGLGDGIISLLFILNALYDSAPGTLLFFDEPELSLHPQLIRRLGEVFSEFAQKRQIVIFTHSPNLVSWTDIQAGAEIARVFKVGADSMIAQPGREIIQNVSKVQKGWRNPHTLGIDATDALFLDDKLIVVEGQEDAALLPRAFEYVGVPFEGTVFGWGSGGEGNIIKIVGFLRALGFTRIVALFDNNVPEQVAKVRNFYPGVHVAEIPAKDIRDKSQDGELTVEGLLDEKGRRIKDELRKPAEEVFTRISSFLRSGDESAQM